MDGHLWHTREQGLYWHTFVISCAISSNVLQVGKGWGWSPSPLFTIVFCWKAFAPHLDFTYCLLQPFFAYKIYKKLMKPFLGFPYHLEVFKYYVKLCMNMQVFYIVFHLKYVNVLLERLVVDFRAYTYIMCQSRCFTFSWLHQRRIAIGCCHSEDNEAEATARAAQIPNAYRTRYATHKYSQHTFFTVNKNTIP